MAIVSIIDECPELNYFKIVVKFQGSVKAVAPPIATFESSLGLKSLAAMGFNEVVEISPVEKNHAVHINFHYYGIYLAETSKYYKPENMDGLLEDYYISKLSGLRQGT